MKPKKVLKISLGVIAALILLMTCTVLFWLGPTVKMIAQRIGPKALGTSVTIDKLSINPRKGVIHLSGFAIANHENYARSNAVSMASLDIEVDIASIFSSTVMVHQVQINSPHFIFEMGSASDNIAEYIRNIEEFIGYDPAIPPTPEERKKKEEKKKKLAEKKKKKGGKPPKVVIVQSLEINDIQFHLAHTDTPRLDIGIGLEQLSVSMTNGTVQLKNMYVNNPGQLQSKDLFTLDSIRVKMEPESIYNPPLKVMDVQIHNPQFFIEWAYDASTVSEFLQIAESTRERVMDWPLPPKDPGSTNEIVVAAIDSTPPPPPPEIHAVSMTNFQFHLVNSIYNNRTIEVKLDCLSTDLMKGTVDVGAFTITNPRRLKLPNLFTLDGISIELDPATLFSNKVSIADIQIKKPYLFLESNPDTDTVSELMKIADTITSRLPSNIVAQASISTNELAAIEQLEEDIEESIEDIVVEPPIELHNLHVDDIQIKFLDSVPSNAPTDPRMLAGIGSISVKLVEGKIQISEISIPNAEGFQETNLFHLANIDIAIDPDSVFSDQMNIEQIFVNSPEINLEQNETSGNVAALQKTLAPLIPPTPEKEQPADQDIPKTDIPAAVAISTSGTNATINEVEAVTVISNALPAALIIAEDGSTNGTIAASSTNGISPFADMPVILTELIVTNLALNLTLPPDPSLSSTNGAGHKMNLSALKPSTYMTDKNQTNELGISEITLVSYSDLHLHPLDGHIRINNLFIGNPEGFSSKHLVKIDQFEIVLDISTLESETLMINEILIQKPRVAYERQIRTDNIKALQASIEGAIARRKEDLGRKESQPDELKAEEAAPVTADAGTEQKVIIGHLLVSNGLVKAKISALPSAPIPLPDIEKFNMGKEQGGTSLTEASTALFETFYDAIIGSVGSATGLATDTLKGAGSISMDAMGNLFDGMGNMFSKAGKGVGHAADAVAESVEKVKKKRKSRGAGGRRSPLR